MTVPQQPRIYRGCGGCCPRHVFAADLVETANDTAHDEAPEALNRVRVNRADDILPCAVRAFDRYTSGNRSLDTASFNLELSAVSFSLFVVFSVARRAPHHFRR